MKIILVSLLFVFVISLQSFAGQKKLKKFGEDVKFEVVQAETATHTVTRSGGYAFPISTSTGTLIGVPSQGASDSATVVKLVAEDIILNSQNVRLQCQNLAPCHYMHPGQYSGQLKGDILWSTSVLMLWNKKQEKLVPKVIQERWKIVGSWP